MPRRTTQPKRVRVSVELSIALIIEWTGERVMYNSSSETNANNKIYPQTIVKDAINIILNTATNVSEESKLKAFQNGSIINMRKIMSLSTCANFNMNDLGCEGGEGGYRLTLSLLGGEKNNVTVGTITENMVVDTKSSTSTSSKVQPVLPLSTPAPAPPAPAPPTPPTPTPPTTNSTDSTNTTPTKTDPIEFIKQHIFTLPLLSQTLTPPIALILKYMENIIKTPNSLQYKNRRTINTSNKTFQTTILSPSAPLPTFSTPCTVLNTSSSTQKSVSANPFLHLFTLLGFTLTSPPSSPLQLVISPSVESSKPTFTALRTSIYNLCTTEFGPTAFTDKTPKFVDCVTSLSPSSEIDFNPYSTFRHSTQSQPTSSGKSKTEAELNMLKKKQQAVLGKDEGVVSVKVMKKEVYDFIERKRREENLRSTEDASDGNLLSSHLQRSLSASLKREAGFTTKAMRDVESLKNSKIYKNSKVRIVMPDSNIIEVTINNGEKGDGGKVGKALKVVEEEVFRGGEEYGIYVTPPRTEVDFERTWKEEGMVPTGKCFLYWKNTSGSEPWWKDDVKWSGEVEATASTVPRGERIEVDHMDVEEKEEKKEIPKKEKKERVSEEEMIRRMMGGKKKR
ncbi:hypothetical protein TrST_g4561 [Triparma strigata]|uniref:Uncharacterized protein n=2 Tax=Triparma strigata TaxID=1606541 RepID=A0A9W7AWC9_9STRA|nr:hypothetical protein TrST_g4561 [Triparma strigata]